MLKTHQAVEKERKQRKRVIPYLLFIHCLVDNEEIRKEFQKSFTSMSRKELDNQNNPTLCRQDVWMLIAKKWKDRDYNPSTTVYPDLHGSFRK